MTSEPHAAMHTDHRQWLADLAMWQDDLALWRRELSAASADLDRAAAALEDHRKSTGCHGGQLQQEQERVAEHERVIAGYDHGEPAYGVVQVVEGHPGWTERHLRLRDAHERLKRHHHTILTKIAPLLKALAEPM